MPCTRNQATIARLIVPSAGRPCTKLLMPNGVRNTTPIIASAKKSLSPFSAKKPKSPDRTLRASAFTGSPLEDRRHALPARGADRDEAAPRAAPGELLRERRH